MTKLKAAKNTVRNSNHLTQEEKDKILNEFINELQMSENIKSDHTLVKHLQKIRNIKKGNPELDLVNTTYSENLSLKIRRQIKNSKYKRDTSKYSEYSKRNKEDHWITWKYWSRHIMNREEDLPDAYFTSNKEQVDVQADTRPEDLPTAQQMRKLLRTLPQVSSSKTSLRNQAVFALIWSIGTRSGETFPIQMKDVDIRDDQVRVYIHGTKSSDDGWVRVIQCSQLLRQYVQQHPAKDNPDAYLFPQLYRNNHEKPVQANQIAKKMRQAKTAADLDFKTYGEPFHIFRKACVTFNVVNDILSWEGLCKKQRKSGDGTKPDYLLQAMSDVEAREAENLGLDENTVQEGRMTGKPLMPQKCMDCGRKNTCIAENCVECQGELEQNQMPKNMEPTEEQVEDAVKQELIQQNKKLFQLAEKAGVNLEDEDLQ